MRTAEDAACRKCYERIAAAVRRHGIRPDEIAKSRELCRREEDGFTVDEVAYKPTGLALGCPLPDPGFDGLLREAAREFADRLDERRVTPGAGFAFVPPPWYHVTVVNYTHFDEVARWDEVVALPESTLRLVEDHLMTAGHPAPRVRFRGLLLTDSGRLLAPGLALNDTIFALRRELVRLQPRFGEHVPPTVHVKLGHMLWLPGSRGREAVLAIVDQLGRRVDREVTFPALHSPLRDLCGVFGPEAPAGP